MGHDHTTRMGATFEAWTTPSEPDCPDLRAGQHIRIIHPDGRVEFVRVTPLFTSDDDAPPAIDYLAINRAAAS